MSDREAILAAIRAAYSSAPPGESVVPRSYRAAGASGDLAELFNTRVQEYGVTVTRTASEGLQAALTQLVAGRSAVVAPDAPWELAGAVVDTGLAARELDEIEVVVTTSAIAIAETGTVVLDHGPGQGRRALSLVPDTHVCVVRLSDVVASVPQAFAKLDPDRPQTWISGPSATSDIELQRVAGVHGPRTLHIVLVEDA